MLSESVAINKYLEAIVKENMEVIKTFHEYKFETDGIKWSINVDDHSCKDIWHICFQADVGHAVVYLHAVDINKENKQITLVAYKADEWFIFNPYVVQAHFMAAIIDANVKNK